MNIGNKPEIEVPISFISKYHNYSYITVVADSTKYRLLPSL